MRCICRHHNQEKNYPEQLLTFLFVFKTGVLREDANLFQMLLFELTCFKISIINTDTHSIA